MPFVPSVVVPPLQPGAAQPGSGYAVPPSQVSGGSLGVRQIIEAGDGILVNVGATTVVSLDTAYTSALYAPLASPAFTGTPTAPTAALGTNTTQLATTAFVDEAIATIVVGAVTAATVTFAPTGNIAATNVQAAIAEVDAEKAALVHTHPQSEVTDLVADLALKAPLASPALTGTPTAPTATLGTNTTQIATTAFVLANGGGGGTAVGTTFTAYPAGGLSSTNVQAAIQEVADERAPLASPNFTGDVELTGASGTERYYKATTAGSLRWGWGAEDNNESGSNTGSRFSLMAYDDSGAQLGRVFEVTRASRLVTFSGAAIFSAAATFDGVVQTKTTQRSRQAVTATASTSINRVLGDYVDLTMSASITTLTLSNWPASGTMGQIHLALTFTGAFTITWPAAVKWPGGTAPTLTGVSGKADHIMLVSDDGGTTVWGFVMGQNYDA